MAVKNTRKAVLPFFILTLIFSLLTLLVCLRKDAPVRIVGSVPDPRECCDAFFEALNEGDYNAASACCNPALPSETVPEEGEATELYALLRKSWQGRTAGEAVIEGSSIRVPAVMTVTDIGSLYGGVKEDINVLLAEYVEEARLSSDVYNEDGSYRDEVVRRAWEEALSARRERAQEYSAERELMLTLRYAEREWRIVPDEALLSALSGEF